MTLLKIIGKEYIDKLGEMITFKFTDKFHMAGVKVLDRFMQIWGQKLFRKNKFKIMLFKGC